MPTRLIVFLTLLSLLVLVREGAAESVDVHVTLPGHECRSTSIGHEVFGDTHLPFEYRWEGYTVRIDRPRADGGTRLQIVDKFGKTRKEIDATYFDLRSVDLGSLGPALWIDARPQSNIQQNRRTYIIAARPKLHTVLVVENGIDHIREVGPHHWILIITTTVAVMEWIGNICHGCAPDITMVLGWNGHGFSLENRRFPDLSLAEARAYRTALPKSFSDDFNVGDAIGYYGNLETIGRGRSALTYLHRHLSTENWRHFKELLPEAKQRLRKINKLFWIDDNRKYVVAG